MFSDEDSPESGIEYENQDLLLNRLEQMLEALELLPGRFKDISKPEDFFATPTNREHLDSICMVLLAVGEYDSASSSHFKIARTVMIFRLWRMSCQLERT